MTAGLQTLRTAWKEGGVGLVGRRVEGRISKERRRLRRTVAPTALELMLDSNWSLVRSAQDALLLVLAHEPDSSRDIEEAIKQGQRHWDHVRSSGTGTREHFGPVYDLERESALFVYAYCRLRRPSLIVETGVARGMSAAMILHALAENQHGLLVSFDIRSDVGDLVDPQASERWNLVELRPDPPSARQELADHLRGLGPIDVFLHDSDHSREQQLFEYGLALRHLSPRGLLLSDDVEGTRVFGVGFPNERSILALADTRKCLGISWIAAASRSDKDAHTKPAPSPAPGR